MPDIRIEKFSFTYAGSSQAVLHTLDLTIPEGEFVLLAGPSGCGKSTLALALAGLIPSRIAGRVRGGIYLGEKNISRMDIHEIAQHVGMVFQNPDEQLVHLDVESEVAFGPENLNLPRTEIAQRIEQALAYTGMSDYRYQEIYALSGGQKQRVAIAATLAMRPNVLILDEPTSDLDPVGTQEVLRVLRLLNEQYGMTIVLVEHKIDEVIPWVDRVILMDNGRICVDDPPHQAFTDIQTWQGLGVSVPQTILLARALPDVFQGALPLSVDDAIAALQGTHYAEVLLQQSMLQQPEDSLSIAPAQQAILSWDNVSLAYGSNYVLRDITAHIMPQEWVAIIGPNGSGKTSLASLAMGFQSPTSGTVRQHGQRVLTGKISQQAERMAYLFQAADTMLFEATVEKEFLFGVRHRRQHKEPLPFSIDQLLETVDLTQYRQSNPFNLSFGQRKRLAIGVLLTRFPDLLLLDEPTTGQDEGHARAFLSFLQQLREHERFSYVMITHDMRAVAHYANRVIVLHNGHIALNGSPAEVFAQEDVLAQCSILPPPIAQIHARLCKGRAMRVHLTLSDLLQSLQLAGVMP